MWKPDLYCSQQYFLIYLNNTPFIRQKMSDWNFIYIFLMLYFKIYIIQGSKADSNVCLHTNCYLVAWPAKHRQVADLLANMRDWRCLQDCENCVAMKQSVALVGGKIPFDPNIIILNYIRRNTFLQNYPIIIHLCHIFISFVLLY